MVTVSAKTFRSGCWSPIGLSRRLVEAIHDSRVAAAADLRADGDRCSEELVLGCHAQAP